MLELRCHLEPLAITRGIGLGARDHRGQLIILARGVLDLRVELGLPMRKDRRLHQTILVQSDIVEGLARGLRLQACHLGLETR